MQKQLITSQHSIMMHCDQNLNIESYILGINIFQCVKISIKDNLNIYPFIKYEQLNTLNTRLNMNSETDSDNQQNSQEYKEYGYRWVLVCLMSLGFFVNALANNAVIPIAFKLSQIYSLSDTKVDAPVSISFLVYSLMNFPANYLIDKRGLRFSLIAGLLLYTLGLFLFSMINKSYNLVIIGAVVVALGQPFVINCPAKIAAFWFSQKNRTVATAIMMSANLLATVVGFVLPTLIVKQQSTEEQTKNQVERLYSIYFIIGLVAFILQIIFMRQKPPTPTSKSSELEKAPILQSFRLIGRDKSLYRFFGAYIIMYGTFLTMGAISNQMLKPYGFTDTKIAILGVFTILSGVAGSIYHSNQIKITQDYKGRIRLILFCSMIAMVTYSVCINLSPIFFITAIFASCLGFNLVPMVPISYDLACELAFPIGQAQVIGILNGGSMILAFSMTLLISHVVGFGSIKQSLVLFIIFNIILICGALLYSTVQIKLKRTDFENQNKKQDIYPLQNDKKDNTIQSDQKLSIPKIVTPQQYQVMVQQS